MAPKRSLPERRNPLLAPEYLTSPEILVERRRLGQTNLSVRPGQTGVTNATKPENLGKFDYAHLRVPLPQDLSGSGIFTLQRNQSYPESYFLMRRSSDGYVSATGMFKAAFPWASIDDEETERQHHKKLPLTSADEVAGNIWVAPETALKLSEEYDLKPFIVALLDPAPIEKGNSRSSITSPPKYRVSNEDIASVTPSQAPGSVRKRTLRSASPSKIATPGGRKIASPRKPRTGRKSKTDDAAAASSTLQSALKDAVENGTGAASVTTTSSAEGEKLPNGTPAATPKKKTKKAEKAEKADKAEKSDKANDEDAKVRIEVDESVQNQNGIETTTTNVRVELPAGRAELPLPQDAEGMVAKAKEMVDAANKLEETRAGNAPGSPTTKRPRAQRKRKVEDLDEDGESAESRTKRAKVLEDRHRRDKVRTRAMVGITATLAIGAVIPYFF